MPEKPTYEELLVENEKLRLRLEDAEQSPRLLRMNRLYSVLSQTNHTIVRATERGSLFEEICKIAVEQGGLLMAWVGLVDEDSGLVRPAAWYGKNEGYLITFAYPCSRSLKAWGRAAELSARRTYVSPAIS